ncbi:MAG: solute carrier family 23 protein [Dorea sp.]
MPLTSFSQNVGLVTMTQVINRFTILMGAFILILSSLFPPLRSILLIPCHRQFLWTVQL